MDINGAGWKKSSWSASGNCVEVAQLDVDRIGVRDSKDQHGPALVFTASEWQAFIGGVKDGEFDL
ncbi:DUF397 domain-containing protein [Herbidospora daliensis]|uniref:DUF397 domain-containing protein n=1 Tax=Herbidospora daliensis TaxID=295585 RepID=UPI000782DDC6|nr:DUF397 domain-containing protein [Herbidospora daliensis]